MKYEFRIESGQVHLSDPCYDLSTWCGKYNVPAKNGTWFAEVLESNNRIAQFGAYHEDHEEDWVSFFDQDFGVDSGQFGIFDVEIYDPESDYDTPGFYRDCCDVTLSRAMCGVVQNRGFVSSTGWGDGSYSAEAKFDENGNLVKFMITFIGDEEE